VLTRDDIEEIAGALPETTIERSPDGRRRFASAKSSTAASVTGGRMPSIRTRANASTT
jgi:hypothetical protein